jgi:hypothetical protein
VQYDPQTGSGRVTTRALNAVGLLNRIHHAHGISHEYWVNNAWGWMLFVVSVALLVLAATGIVMWFTRHDDRRIGALVLGAGLTWGLTLLVLMRSS